MENSSLVDFAGDEVADGQAGADRPAEEAAVVAGDGDGAVTSELVDASSRRYPDADGVTELAVTQVDYTIEGSGPDERAVLNVFGRTTENAVEHVRVHEFEPYFYAPLDSFEGAATATEPVTPADLADSRLENDRITGCETDDDGTLVLYESIRGERLVKVFGQTPRDVGQLRDRFTHYEADILFPNRLLIDKDITSGVRVPCRRAADGSLDVHHDEVEAVEVDADLRVCTFDIEVDDRNGFPEDGEEPILCLTSHDSYRDEYVNWLYEAPGGEAGPDALSDFGPISDGASYEVRRFDSEPAMLAAFLDYVDETDGDVITGWNVDDFDAPYLVDRLNELGPNTGYDLDYNRLSRVNQVWESNWGGPNIKGRVLFDLLYGYKRTQFTELDSYRLDAVGEVELGIGKERYAGSIGDLWETDPERLLEYNTRDVELCVELDRKQQVIAFFEEVATFVGCKLEDAPTPGDAVDMYVLHKAHDRFALPSKGQQEAEDFEGGAVFDPISGVMEMVSVLDLKSLYPMAMTTINASPETKVDPAAFDGETYRAPNGQHFRKQPDGMMREMIDELLTEREEKKAMRNEHQPGAPEYDLYDRQQGAVKVIMNSLYGVSGWDRFRLYDKENAAAVTATGREVINFTETAVNELDHQVAYGDTDSVMLSLGDMSKEEAIETSFDIEEYVNGRYEDFAREELNADDHRFEIEFEKLYRRFFQAGKKKRYAGHIVWKEGKDVDDIDITGFEYKRSDIAPITKEVQQHVLDLIVTSEGDEYRDAVTEYVHDVIQEFKAGDVSVEEIGIPGGIGKRLDNYDTDTAHVRGAKYANLLLGTNFARGSKPKRLYLEKVHPSFFERAEAERGLDARENPLYGEFKRDPDVICIEYDDQLPEEFRVDYDKMLEKTLKGPIERIIEAVGVSWDEVESGQEQTGLGSFM